MLSYDDVLFIEENWYQKKECLLVRWVRWSPLQNHDSKLWLSVSYAQPPAQIKPIRFCIRSLGLCPLALKLPMLNWLQLILTRSIYVRFWIKLVWSPMLNVLGLLLALNIPADWIVLPLNTVPIELKLSTRMKQYKHIP